MYSARMSIVYCWYKHRVGGLEPRQLSLYGQQTVASMVRGSNPGLAKIFFFNSSVCMASRLLPRWSGIRIPVQPRFFFLIAQSVWLADCCLDGPGFESRSSQDFFFLIAQSVWLADCCLDGPGFESRSNQDFFSFFFKPCRQTLKPTQRQVCHFRGEE